MNKLINKPLLVLTDVILILIGFSSLVIFLTGDYLKLAGNFIFLFLIILPQYFYSHSKKHILSSNLIDLFTVVISFGCFTNLIGTLGFYQYTTTWWYDLIIHFINPIFIFTLTSLFVILYQHYFFNKVNIVFTLIGNFLLIIFGSFLWEFFEYLLDIIFGTMMFGQNGEIYLDTISDLVADIAGGLVATIIIYTYFFKYALNNLNFKHDN